MGKLDATILTPRKRITSINLQKDTKQKEFKKYLFNHQFKINHNNVKNQIKFNQIQTIVSKPRQMQKNNYKGDKLTELKSNHIRLFYININGIEWGTGD